MWILLVLPSCVAYHAAPIDPVKSEASFSARTLQDQGLAEWAGPMIEKGKPFPPESWDFESLALAAFWFHPDLDVARAEARTARAGVITASALPNPTLGFRPEYVLNPDPGDSSWVTDLGLDFVFETAGKRDLRTERAQKLALAAEVGTYETAWRVRSGVRAALFDHLFALQELELVRRELEPRRETLDLLRRRIAAGEAGRPEAARAETERSRIEIEVRNVETQVATSRAALAAAIGVPASAVESLSLRRDLGEPQTELPVSTARELGLLQRFDLRRALLEYDAAEADLRIEIAKQYPDLTLGPGYVYDQGVNRLAFNFAMPLHLLDRNQGPISQAEARRSEAQARFLALQARAIGEIEGGIARYRGALAELAEARALAARQREIEQALRRAFAAGATDALDLALARAEVAALARVELLALRHAEEGLGDLENALQRPLETVGAVPDSLPERVER